jgi:methyltransferase (TIGR00027 family)
MEEGRPSFTAIGSAMVRAKHLHWDDPPKIFEDSFALRLSGLTDEKALRERLDAALVEFAAIGGRDIGKAAFSSVCGEIVLRSRYVEDELDQATRRGVDQYVILGAGLDSFAYRRPDLAEALRVFEVDHAATQAWKRTRLQELSLATAPNLVFVPVDFERDSLVESLFHFGYRTGAAGFFSWLAVTQYLTREAIFHILRMVASMAPGTEIIFEYYLSPVLLEDEDRQILMLYGDRTAAQGEPHHTYFEPTELTEQVRKLGFSKVWDFGPEEADAQYCANRADGLLLRIAHFMGARV